MDFRLTDEQEQIKTMVREFALSEIKPHLAKWDEEQHFPVDTFRRAGELGILAVTLPEEYGGAGLSYVDYSNVIEELGVVDSGFGLSVAAHNSLGTGHIYLAGNEEQKKKWLPKLATGEWIGAWGLTEPGSGSDASGLRTTAVKDGNEWVLNGTKNFITNATYANISVILAVTDKADQKHGITAFAVEMDRKGIRPGKKENKLGMRVSDTAELVMEDCRVPDANILGKIGYGFNDAMKILDGGRISIGALAIGIARGAFEAARDYSKQRTAFGKPISEFQAIQFMLADMATEIEASRLLCYRAATVKDAGERVTQFSAMAKLYASEVAVRATEKGVQIFGGYGFIKEFPAEKYYRDVKLCTIGEGTSEIQRMVIARHILAEGKRDSLMTEIGSLVEGIRAGRYRALAKAISLVERDAPEVERLLASIYASTGRARIIGITGSPGAGKSTLVAAMARHYRAQKKRVGIIAVDPTSPFTGGAILGDRIRMADLYTDSGVFIRSMATRGFLGGLARATNDVVDLLDASGFDVVLVETVGVGQDEVEVVRTVQTNLVVLVPGMGDDIQAIKAGIMEIGDVFVVNKADRPGADKTVTEVTMMMSLVEEHGDWVPPIVKTVASKSQGVKELDEAIEKHFAYLDSSGELVRRNRERVRIRIETQLKEKFMDRLIGGSVSRADYEALLEDVLHKRNNPHDAAEGVLARVKF